jgi:DNA-binding MarR family transcriptional regulator
MADTGPPAPSLSVLLSLAESRVAERLDAALVEAGTSRRQLGALGHLRREPGMSVSELARRAGITPQSMHATVGQLEQDGLLARAGSGRGRRAGLAVTEVGLDRLTTGLAVVASVDDELRSHLGPQGYETALALLASLMSSGSGSATT